MRTVPVKVWKRGEVRERERKERGREEDAMTTTRAATPQHDHSDLEIISSLPEGILYNSQEMNM